MDDDAITRADAFKLRNEVISVHQEHITLEVKLRFLERKLKELEKVNGTGSGSYSMGPVSRMCTNCGFNKTAAEAMKKRISGLEEQVEYLCGHIDTLRVAVNEMKDQVPVAAAESSGESASQTCPEPDEKEEPHDTIRANHLILIRALSPGVDEIIQNLYSYESISECTRDDILCEIRAPMRKAGRVLDIVCKCNLHRDLYEASKAACLWLVADILKPEAAPHKDCLTPTSQTTSHTAAGVPTGENLDPDAEMGDEMLQEYEDKMTELSRDVEDLKLRIDSLQTADVLDKLDALSKEIQGLHETRNFQTGPDLSNVQTDDDHNKQSSLFSVIKDEERNLIFQQNINRVNNHQVPLHDTDYETMALYEYIAGVRDGPAWKFLKSLGFPEITRDLQLETVKLTPEQAMTRYNEMCRHDFPQDTLFFQVLREDSYTDFTSSCILALHGPWLNSVDAVDKQPDECWHLATITKCKVIGERQLVFSFRNGTWMAIDLVDKNAKAIDIKTWIQTRPKTSVRKTML